MSKRALVAMLAALAIALAAGVVATAKQSGEHSPGVRQPARVGAAGDRQVRHRTSTRPRPTATRSSRVTSRTWGGTS